MQIRINYLASNSQKMSLDLYDCVCVRVCMMNMYFIAGFLGIM